MAMDHLGAVPVGLEEAAVVLVVAAEAAEDSGAVEGLAAREWFLLVAAVTDDAHKSIAFAAT
jgi:hypothetical protein